MTFEATFISDNIGKYAFIPYYYWKFSDRNTNTICWSH